MMKKAITTFFLFFYGYCLCAQDPNIENEIRSLEQTEVQAVLKKDTATLKQLWDKDYIVNNPENRIVLAKRNTVDRPVLQNQRVSFTREVEKILINGDIAISMGNETVIPAGDVPNSGQIVKRRYTNIWMKKDGQWKLVARHANKLCS